MHCSCIKVESEGLCYRLAHEQGIFLCNVGEVCNKLLGDCGSDVHDALRYVPGVHAAGAKVVVNCVPALQWTVVAGRREQMAACLAASESRVDLDIRLLLAMSAMLQCRRLKRAGAGVQSTGQHPHCFPFGCLYGHAEQLPQEGLA